MERLDLLLTSENDRLQQLAGSVLDKYFSQHACVAPPGRTVLTAVQCHGPGAPAVATVQHLRVHPAQGAEELYAEPSSGRLSHAPQHSTSRRRARIPGVWVPHASHVTRMRYSMKKRPDWAAARAAICSAVSSDWPRSWSSCEKGCAISRRNCLHDSSACLP